jgi:Mce-associated membrane protein
MSPDADVDSQTDAPVTPPGWTPPAATPPPSPAPAAAPPRTLAGGLLAGVVITAVGVTLLIAALVVTLLKLRDANAITSARSSALVAARDFSVALSTYDYHHLDRDFTAVADHATGKFKTDFTKASKDLEPLITKYQASSSGAVADAGVRDATADHAVVVVFVDQTVKNSNSPQPRVDRNRLRITLDRTGGSWLVSKVDIV